LLDKPGVPAPERRDRAPAVGSKPVSLIVYVEDEFFARMLGEDVLNAAGYDVLVAADGEEGCALLRRHGSGVSGLITDINLPGVTEGWAVAELGREIREGLAVVYATGSDRSLFAARGVPLSRWIAKPFEWPHVLEAMSALIPAAGQANGPSLQL
jgi:CheY-like chemotaxis protein